MLYFSRLLSNNLVSILTIVKNVKILVEITKRTQIQHIKQKPAMKRIMNIGLVLIVAISMSSCFVGYRGGYGYRDYGYRPYAYSPRVYVAPPRVYIPSPRVYVNPPRYYNRNRNDWNNNNRRRRR